LQNFKNQHFETLDTMDNQQMLSNMTPEQLMWFQQQQAQAQLYLAA
jgi:hypothetical protein